MANEIALFKSFGLATPSTFTYSGSMNAFVGNGYNAPSGNSYFNAARFAEGLLIKEDVGQGQPYTFLNGLHIYDLKTRQLLAEKIYPMYGGAFYSTEVVKSVTRQLLEDLILKEAKAQCRIVNEADVARRLSEVLNTAFQVNQMQELDRHVKALSF